MQGLVSAAAGPVVEFVEDLVAVNRKPVAASLLKFSGLIGSQPTAFQRIVREKSNVAGCRLRQRPQFIDAREVQ